METKTKNRKKIFFIFAMVMMAFLILMIRLCQIMIFQSAMYQQKADAIHERERKIKALRGRILDRNMQLLAANKTVCTISVIHNQITDANQVIQVLSKELELPVDYVKKRVEKYSSIEKVKTNVSKEIGDQIRQYHLNGVKVDEDYRRFYVYDSLASKVIGFTGSGFFHGFFTIFHSLCRRLRFGHFLLRHARRLQRCTFCNGIFALGVAQQKSKNKNVRTTFDRRRKRPINRTSAFGPTNGTRRQAIA